MFTTSIPQTNPQAGRKTPDPVPVVFDDGSALCPSRTTPGRVYEPHYHTPAGGGRPVVTECNCEATRGCWHRRAVLAELVKNLCPQCGSALGSLNLYCAGRYVPYDSCLNAACDFMRRAS